MGNSFDGWEGGTHPDADIILRTSVADAWHILNPHEVQPLSQIQVSRQRKGFRALISELCQIDLKDDTASTHAQAVEVPGWMPA